MTLEERYMDRVRGLDLLERLSPQALQRLLDVSGELVRFAPGDLIFAQGAEDTSISYLLEGRVERTRNGIFEMVIDVDKDRRTRPLDALAQKPYTLHASSPVSVLRLDRGALERAYLDAAPGDGQGVLEVEDIGSATTQDWRTRLLSSQLFATLAAGNIQTIFERMVEIPARAGQDIIRQGEMAGDYYVVQVGTCQVLRNRSGVGPQEHVANLGPGDGFGEESAISGVPRDFTVRMHSDGRVMRLSREDFLALVVRPLVRGVSEREAAYLVAHGFQLIDTREPEQYSDGSMDGARNIPARRIPVDARELDKSASYILCSDGVEAGVLAAFHCIERGLDAVYLEVPITTLLPATSERSDPPAEAIRESPGPTPGAPMETPGSPAASLGREQEEQEKDMSETGNDSAAGKGNGSRPRGNGSPPDAVTDPLEQRVSREEFTDTITGQELADIIDELYSQRREMENSVGVTGAAAGTDPALAAEGTQPFGIPDSLIRDIMGDINQRVSQFVQQSLAARQGELVSRLKDHAAKLEQTAQEKVRAHEAQMRAHFEELFSERERKLRADHERLTALAHRLAQQKAEIQLTRRRLAEMLQTANRVHQAVYRTGAALVSQVDHLAQLDDEPGSDQG
jgi:CRP-like cAMP-binding protein